MEEAFDLSFDITDDDEEYVCSLRGPYVIVNVT